MRVDENARHLINSHETLMNSHCLTETLLFVLKMNFNKYPFLFLSQIALFQQQPQLRQYVRPAIDRAVQELIHPVVERSIKICLTTAEMIVKKVCIIKTPQT
jgi:hypothetical protein